MQSRGKDQLLSLSLNFQVRLLGPVYNIPGQHHAVQHPGGRPGGWLGLWVCGDLRHKPSLAPPQLCEVLNATEMTCQAPALALGPDHQSDLTERPEEFGFILDNVQSLLILNMTNFTYYPNPVFEAFSPSGILELKPGTPIILKVD